MSRHDFMWPLGFMLSVSLLGLHFYPALLIILAILLNRWRQNRYDFAIMTFIFFGSYGLTRDSVIGIKLYDLGLMASLFCLVIIRKPPVIAKAVALWIMLVLMMFLIARQSWESMGVQIYTMRGYWGFIAFAIPLAAFGNHKFDADTFFRRMMVYVLLMCIFYIIDAFILKGTLLIAGNFRWDMRTSLFYKPLIEPFAFKIMRIYPYGLYIAALAIIPIARLYRLKAWMWGLIVLASIATLTFTYIIALCACLILFQPSRKLILKVAGSIAGILVLAYVADCFLPMRSTEVGEMSTLRIKSSVDQIGALTKAVDDEDVAQFASGRLAQAMPKVELIEFYNKEAVGLGFIHPELTKSVKFIVTNEYYTDVSRSEEVATAVEVAPVQVYIHMGWIGLIGLNLFFLGIYLIIRKLRYSSVYLAALLYCFILGLGGFASLATYQGVSIIGVAFAIVVLANRPSLPGFAESKV